MLTDALVEALEKRLEPDFYAAWHLDMRQHAARGRAAEVWPEMVEIARTGLLDRPMRSTQRVYSEMVIADLLIRWVVALGRRSRRAR